MTDSIRPRRGTTLEWETANPILDDGEISVERHEDGHITFKIGNGLDHWANLQGIPEEPPAEPAQNVQEFTTSGTWTKPTGGQTKADIWLIGGGGGGGSGYARAGPTGNCTGGTGGGGGGFIRRTVDLSALPESASVTVGPAGTGGPKVTVYDGFTQAGTAGGSTIFANFVAGGGLGGAGGTQTTSTGPTSTRLSDYQSSTGGSSTYMQTIYYSGPGNGPGGGGGGCGYRGGVGPGAAGPGGDASVIDYTTNGTPTMTGGAAGAPGDTAGKPGLTCTEAQRKARISGSGGGGGHCTNATPGANGGSGGYPGGAGGGGSAGFGNPNSGAGGNGANGYALIVCY